MLCVVKICFYLKVFQVFNMDYFINYLFFNCFRITDILDSVCTYKKIFFIFLSSLLSSTCVMNSFLLNKKKIIIYLSQENLNVIYLTFGIYFIFTKLVVYLPNMMLMLRSYFDKLFSKYIQGVTKLPDKKIILFKSIFKNFFY